LHSAHFRVAQALLFGHAKVMLHSGITAQGQGRSQMHH
jgi:hypothetical protein